MIPLALPCGPTPVDAWALAESVDLVRAAREIRAGLSAFVLLTRKVARTSLGASARRALEGSGLPLLATELAYRVTYQEAPAAGLGVTRYAPRSPAAAEVRALADEIETLEVSP
jgi:chromosome partitioning protein